MCSRQLSCWLLRDAQSRTCRKKPAAASSSGSRTAPPSATPSRPSGGGSTSRRATTSSTRPTLPKQTCGRGRGTMTSTVRTCTTRCRHAFLGTALLKRRSVLCCEGPLPVLRAAAGIVVSCTMPCRGCARSCVSACTAVRAALRADFGCPHAWQLVHRAFIVQCSHAPLCCSMHQHGAWAAGGG